MFASIPQGLSVFEEKTVVAISFMFQDKKKMSTNFVVEVFAFY